MQIYNKKGIYGLLSHTSLIIIRKLHVCWSLGYLGDTDKKLNIIFTIINIIIYAHLICHGKRRAGHLDTYWPLIK